MNKIAAYKIAFQRIEFEKRADFIVNSFGTSKGEMPDAYIHAFDRMMKKEAVLQDIGRGITGLIYSAGKGLSGAAKGTGSGTRQGLGGKMMDWASSTGGKTGQGAALASQGTKSLADFEEGRATTQKILGGTALVGGLGGAYMLGRPSGN